MSRTSFFRDVLRRIRNVFRGEEMAVHGRCRMCGECCRRLSLIHNGRWIRNKRQFAACLKEYPDYSRFRIIGKNDTGELLFDCDRLSDDNTCSDHENRLDICRRYPTLAMLRKGGTTPEGCGFSFVKKDAFKRVLDRALDKADKKDRG